MALRGHLQDDHHHILDLLAEVALFPGPGTQGLHHIAVVASLPGLVHHTHLHDLLAETGDPNPFHLGILLHLLPDEVDHSSQLGAGHPDQYQFPATQNSHPHFEEFRFFSSSP
jgi:hypothetical protein